MERSTNFASAGLKNCFKTFFDTSIQLSHNVSLTARTRSVNEQSGKILNTDVLP